MQCVLKIMYATLLACTQHGSAAGKNMGLNKGKKKLKVKKKSLFIASNIAANQLTQNYERQ
jgi:hypothetical protein